ncbi:unnamed protein product [Fusarium langsethiae]|nr:unnamed protein product [Fusarium langsethiae]
MTNQSNVKFEPDKHLCFEKPDLVYTWADLGFHGDISVSSFCAADPFPLFSADAISEMRKEALQVHVLSDYSYSDDNTAMSMRGYAAAHAPFTSAAWKHPRTLQILSEIAGVELAVKLELELGHVNFGAKSPQKLASIQAPDETLPYTYESDDTSIKSDDLGKTLGWHKDSYPFSCTLMLSNTKRVTGGQIVMALADGRLQKLRQCETGSVVFIQGRHLFHTALRSEGPEVRMTMVCPMWPASPFVQDDTFLTYTRTISDTSYIEYRFNMLIERLRSHQEQNREVRDRGAKLVTKELKGFIHDQITFLSQMQNEIVEEDKIEAWGLKPGVPHPDAVFSIKP